MIDNIIINNNRPKTLKLRDLPFGETFVMSTININDVYIKLPLGNSKNFVFNINDNRIEEMRDNEPVIPVKCELTVIVPV